MRINQREFYYVIYEMYNDLTELRELLDHSNPSHHASEVLNRSIRTIMLLRDLLRPETNDG
jgi:hypothetical protein